MLFVPDSAGYSGKMGTTTTAGPAIEVSRRPGKGWPKVVLGLLLMLLAFSLGPGPSSAQATIETVSIRGRIVDAVTREPIPGVMVNLANGRIRLVTGASGEFAIDAIASGVYKLELSHAAYQPSMGDLAVVQDGEFETSMAPVGAAIEGLDDAFATGLAGIVMDRQTGRPLSGVAVVVPNRQRSAVTDLQGRFTIEDLPAGRHQVEFSMLGYTDRVDSISVEPNRVSVARVGLSVDPVDLEPIEVVVEQRQLSLQEIGFYEREYQGFGEFIDRAAIDAQGPAAQMTDLISRVPGARSVTDRFQPLERYIVLREGQQGSFGNQGFCYPQVVVDGLVTHRGGDDPARLNELVNPTAVAGIEVYPSSTGVPQQYAGVSAACGVIVIWTGR